MQIDIFHDGELIGRGILDASHPPMGVASGPFEPGPIYQRELHAGEIEGVHNLGAANLAFAVRAGDAAVECQAVFIQDYSEGLGERQVTVLGIPIRNTKLGSANILPTRRIGESLKAAFHPFLLLTS